MLPRLLPLALLVLAASCQGGVTLPADGSPGRLRLVSGFDQQGARRCMDGKVTGDTGMVTMVTTTERTIDCKSLRSKRMLVAPAPHLDSTGGPASGCGTAGFRPAELPPGY